MKARERIDRPADIWAIAKSLLKETQETFLVISLDVRNGHIGSDVIGLGTVYSVEAHPRDVFRAAIKQNAAGIILCHNHPSGDTEPSAEDWAMTKRLRECGELLGIPVVDHIIVGSHTELAFYSMCESSRWSDDNA